MEDGSLNDAILSVLNQVSSADASFDTAAALEDVIDEALVRRDQKSNERSLAKTIGRFVAKIYPLAKILVEIGGIAAQVVNFLKTLTLLSSPVHVFLQLLFLRVQLLLWTYFNFISWLNFVGPHGCKKRSTRHVVNFRFHILPSNPHYRLKGFREDGQRQRKVDRLVDSYNGILFVLFEGLS